MYNKNNFVRLEDLDISVSKELLGSGLLKALSNKVKFSQYMASIFLGIDYHTLTDWHSRGRGPKTFHYSSKEPLYEAGELLRWTVKNELEFQKHQTPEQLEVLYGRDAFEWRCAILTENLGIQIGSDLEAYTEAAEKYVLNGGLDREIPQLSYDEAFSVLSLHFQLKMDDSEALIKPLMKAIPTKKTVSVNQLKLLARDLNLERKKYDR